MSNRAGYYRNNLIGEAEYKSFVPSPLPLMLQMDGELITELAKAHRMIGMLEGKLSQLPYAETFISMSICKEALMSSQIEGIRATFEDLLAPSTSDDDAEDAVNNVKAIKAAIRHLDELPVSSRLIRHAHRVLLSGSRGQSKEPGKYRHSQNWIGRAGSTLRTAIYVPPNVEDMNAAMSDLEKYINDESDGTDALIKAGLIHYQFETIHPFLDGNGRIGRLLVVLYLMSRGVLSTPVLCISYAMKKHQMEYYEKMGELTYSPCLKAGDSSINDKCQIALVLLRLLYKLMPQLVLYLLPHSCLYHDALRKKDSPTHGYANLSGQGSYNRSCCISGSTHTSGL